jgi:hypothetical protein
MKTLFWSLTACSLVYLYQFCRNSLLLSSSNLSPYNCAVFALKSLAYTVSDVDTTNTDAETSIYDSKQDGLAINVEESLCCWLFLECKSISGHENSKQIV